MKNYSDVLQVSNKNCTLRGDTESVQLALDIANFTLDLYNDINIVGDKRIFTAAHEYRKIQQNKGKR